MEKELQMSQRLNHDKVNMQKRIARESHQYDDLPTESGFSVENRYRNRPEKWLAIKIRKHYGKTLPKIVFEDPGYIAWLNKKGILLGWMHTGEYAFKLAHQFQVVLNQMTHIKPPAGCEFAIVVDDVGVFRKFIVVKKGRRPKKPLKKGWKIVQRLELLDIFIPSLFRNPKLGFERMSRCLLKFCFGDADAEIDANACKDFLQDNDHFDLKGIKSNKWLKPSPKDRAVLEKKFAKLVASRGDKTIKKYLK
jgi:hypothetical protein